MFMLLPVVAAVMLVFLGYVAVWTSSRHDTPKVVVNLERCCL